MLRVLELPLPVGGRQVLADVLELPGRHAGVGRRQHELRVRRGDVDEPARLVVSLLLLFLRLRVRVCLCVCVRVCVSDKHVFERQVENPRRNLPTLDTGLRGITSVVHVMM